MSTALVPIADLDRMAAAVVASKLFGMATKEQALALMLVAQAEGLHPATAARDYHIIQGRPALKADAMLGRYLNSGGKVEWHEHTDAKVSATFSHPAGGALKIEWDMARARQAGLGEKPTWKQYPRQMLRARVISEGVRATNPAVAIGIYTPEEVQEFGNPKEKNMGAAIVIPPEEAAAEEIEKVSAAQIEALKTALSVNGVELAALLAKADLTNIADLAASDAPKAIEWIRSQKRKEKATPI